MWISLRKTRILHIIENVSFNQFFAKIVYIYWELLDRDLCYEFGGGWRVIKLKSPDAAKQPKSNPLNESTIALSVNCFIFDASQYRWYSR